MKKAILIITAAVVVTQPELSTPTSASQPTTALSHAATPSRQISARPEVARISEMPPGNRQPAAGRAPAWFEKNYSTLQGICEMSRVLTVPGSALFRGPEWDVVAAVVRDEHGAPLPRTAIVLIFDYTTAMRTESLVTDDHGYFMIYGCSLVRPFFHDITLDGARKRVGGFPEIVVYPGCPPVPAGWMYATSKGITPPCGVRMVERQDHAQFFEITVAGSNHFDSQAFQTFLKAPRPVPKFPDRPQQPPPPTAAPPTPEGCVRTTYTLRLLDPDGNPVSGATLEFWPEKGPNIQNQVARTNKQGECQFEEFPRIEDAARLPAILERTIGLNATGYGQGPMHIHLRADRINTIRLQSPGSITGIVTDSNRFPVPDSIQLEYELEKGLQFNRSIASEMDGSFTISDIMPDARFTLITTDWQPTFWGLISTRTSEITLQPGEKRQVQLTAPAPASLRGVVTAMDGKLKPADDYSGCYPEVLRVAPGGKLENLQRDQQGIGTWLWGPPGSRFVFPRLPPGPIRVRVTAPGYVPYLSGEIQLSPGKLRFMTVVLAPEKGPGPKGLRQVF